MHNSLLYDEITKLAIEITICTTVKVAVISCSSIAQTLEMSVAKL